MCPVLIDCRLLSRPESSLPNSPFTSSTRRHSPLRLNVESLPLDSIFPHQPNTNTSSGCEMWNPRPLSIESKPIAWPCSYRTYRFSDWQWQYSLVNPASRPISRSIIVCGYMSINFEWTTGFSTKWRLSVGLARIGYWSLVGCGQGTVVYCSPWLKKDWLVLPSCDGDFIHSFMNRCSAQSSPSSDRSSDLGEGGGKCSTLCSLEASRRDSSSRSTPSPSSETRATG